MCRFIYKYLVQENKKKCQICFHLLNEYWSKDDMLYLTLKFHQVFN